VELMEAKKQLEETNRELERAGVQLQQANAGLELRVRQRTSELEAANQELEAFSYSVSHDLRAPLRHIASFSGLVLNNSAAQLDKANLRHLNAIGVAAERMSGLIEALLQLSRVSRGKLSRQPVDLTALAGEVLAELQQSAPRHGADVSIAPGITAEGDQRLLRIVLTNLLGNAWKFTSKRAGAQIEFGIAQNETDSPYFVRDNGAGFDMAYVNNLFTAFQRLHCQDEFEGTGVGLATVQRIIRRHGGKIWAQGAPNEGAAFFFTLGEEKNHENTHCR
jgi:light-regulated signal transduction histidine kinase (bacteriophytochrome)